MIMSRQNKNYQTWSAAQNDELRRNTFSSLRREPKKAPKLANGAVLAQQDLSQPFRSLTLNRLDMQRNKSANGKINGFVQHQRNAPSLGTYPSPNVQPPPTPQVNTLTRPPQPNKVPANETYAPASIASPREFTHRQKINHQPVESAHYAATSFRGQSRAPSESGRSGRESALGNLLGRTFGTLTRRGKWRRSINKVELKNGALAGTDAIPPEQQQTALDPEIYATGKREVGAEEIYAEGSRAIDGNSQRRLFHYQINEQLMVEGETLTIVDELSKQQPEYQALVSSLTNWINDELAQQRIIVTDLQEDLYDGQILGKLIEKLHHIKLDMVEVTQNEATQRHKLRVVLDQMNRILSLQARWARIRWSVEGIHSKSMVEIIHLLVTLAQYYRAPIKIPPNLQAHAIVVEKLQGQLISRHLLVQLTEDEPSEAQLSSAQQRQRDAFDALVEHAPDKLLIVKTSLVRFANRQLNKINMSCLADRVNEVLDPEQFSDGLLFVFLIASLEDYFVPLGNLFTASPSVKKQTSAGAHGDDNESDSGATLTTSNLQTALEPDSYINTLPIHKLHNVNLALILMEEAGVEIRSKVRAEDIASGDLKSILRVLYALFSRYKHL